MSLRTEDLAASDDLKVYKLEEDDDDITKNDDDKSFMHNSDFLDFMQTLNEISYNYYRNTGFFPNGNASSGSFSNLTTNPLLANSNRIGSNSFHPLNSATNSSINQSSKLQNDFINKHQTSINSSSFSPLSLSSHNLSSKNLLSNNLSSHHLSPTNLPLSNSLANNLSNNSSLVANANLAAINNAAQFYQNQISDSLYRHDPLMNLNLAAFKLQQQTSNVSSISSPITSSISNQFGPTTPITSNVANSLVASSPYAMFHRYNLLLNGAISTNNSHLTINNKTAFNSFFNNGSDANNNNTNQNTDRNMSTNHESTCNTKNSSNNLNSLFDTRQTNQPFNHQSTQSSFKQRLEKLNANSTNFRMANLSEPNDLADFNCKDLSKENHLNYSNVNNSLFNQTSHQHLNQKSSLLNGTTNASLTNYNGNQFNSVASIASLVDQSNTINSLNNSIGNSFISPFYYNNQAMYDHLTKASSSIKKESFSPLVNDKLFTSSASFPTNHLLSANSLNKLHNELTNSRLSNEITNGFNLNNRLANGMTNGHNLQTANSLTSNLNSSGNSAFSSNSAILPSACSPHSSSSANSAASALSAFSLTESNKKPFYSSLANNNSTVNGKSTGANADKCKNSLLNNVQSSSKRTTSTPLITSSLASQLNDLNNAAFNHQLPFSQLNPHISPHLSQHLNQQLNQHLNHHFSQQLNSLDAMHNNPLSQASSANLNTSNSNSLGSLNDSTGDLSDSMSKSISNSLNKSTENQSNKETIKKPLNAFMLFMADFRRKVLSESETKESATINQKLGKMWRDLSPQEQEAYFKKAKELRELHHKRYPNWTAKDNYAINNRKKKRKKEKTAQMRQFKEYTNNGALKKCRARYGLKQRDKWCKLCLRKKRCERYKDSLDNK